MPRYLVVVDTPGIKQFVFGTDPLAEIRGASAILDRLNRNETKEILREQLRRQNADLDRTIYANGGTGQFVVEAETDSIVLDALAGLSRHYRAETGGEVRIAFGLAELAEEGGPGLPYQEAARAAYDQLRARREMEFAWRTPALLPLVKECESTSHLPAQLVERWGGEPKLLSRASSLKRQEVRERHQDRWSEWMEWLTSQDEWPDPSKWRNLQCNDIEEIGHRARRRGYVALIYADGNAMGRLVQELDSAETCGAFSKLVDDGIRRACFEALGKVCGAEIQKNRTALAAPNWGELHQLPADILLLGGDDLLVLLPADRALPFAELVAVRFEELTREEIVSCPVPTVRSFFEDRVGTRGLTLSFGVAIARASYPFFLLLELAEQLLRNAKTGGSSDSRRGRFRAPAYVDFHLITGASSLDLEEIRTRDYQTNTSHRRTFRPLAMDALGNFRRAVSRLRASKSPLPRSKLHDLFEAALMPRRQQAERTARELFSRCKPDQRTALWEALECLGMIAEFPWHADSSARQPRAGRSPAAGTWTGALTYADPSPNQPGAEKAPSYATALADLVELTDLLPEES
jgi:hypothetical protein